MAIRAVIWDLGGVILRTEDPAPRQQLAARLGIDRLELEKIVFESESAKLASLGLIREEEHWKNLSDHFQLSAEELVDFERMFWAGDLADKGLVHFIKTLRKVYRTGLLSNAWSAARQVVNQRYFCLEEVFDVIIFSAEVGLAKPDERIYRLVMDRLDVTPPEAVFIDDFKENIEAAQRLGIHTVHFRDWQESRKELEKLLKGQ